VLVCNFTDHLLIIRQTMMCGKRCNEFDRVFFDSEKMGDVLNSKVLLSAAVRQTLGPRKHLLATQLGVP